MQFIKGMGYVGVFVIFPFESSTEQTSSEGDILSIQVELKLLEYTGKNPEEKEQEGGLKNKVTEFYNYITKNNDRWDLISYKFYNDSTKYELIIKANPRYTKLLPVIRVRIKLKFLYWKKRKQLSL